MAKDKLFIETYLKPNVNFVEQFRRMHNRLPTNKEFHSQSPQLTVEYIRSQHDVPDEISTDTKGIDWSKNYVIAVWRGEWNEYYISHGEKFITNEYGPSDGIIGFIVCLGFGAVPIIIYFLVKKKKSIA